MNDGQISSMCALRFSKRKSGKWMKPQLALYQRGRFLPSSSLVLITQAVSCDQEYLPFVDETLSPPEAKPEGPLYPQFLAGRSSAVRRTLLPCAPALSHRVLGGSSYGAGIALFTVISRPELSPVSCLKGPSVYADNYHLLKRARSVREWPARIYIGTGTVQEPLEDVNMLRELFQTAGP